MNNKLLTPEFEELFKKYPLSSQIQERDPLIVAKLYAEACYYLLEYDPKTWIAVGYKNWSWTKCIDLKQFYLKDMPRIHIDENFESIKLSDLSKIIKYKSRLPF